MNTPKDFRTCTECHSNYFILQNHLVGRAADGSWHEGHIACVRPIIQPDAPQEVLAWDAASIAYNRSRGYKD